jgi:hypothetical protein
MSVEAFSILLHKNANFIALVAFYYISPTFSNLDSTSSNELRVGHGFVNRVDVAPTPMVSTSIGNLDGRGRCFGIPLFFFLSHYCCTTTYYYDTPMFSSPPFVIFNRPFYQ